MTIETAAGIILGVLAIGLALFTVESYLNRDERDDQ